MTANHRGTFRMPHHEVTGVAQGVAMWTSIRVTCTVPVIDLLVLAFLAPPQLCPLLPAPLPPGYPSALTFSLFLLASPFPFHLESCLIRPGPPCVPTYEISPPLWPPRSASFGDAGYATTPA